MYRTAEVALVERGEYSGNAALVLPHFPALFDDPFAPSSTKSSRAEGPRPTASGSIAGRGGAVPVEGGEYSVGEPPRLMDRRDHAHPDDEKGHGDDVRLIAKECHTE